MTVESDRKSAPADLSARSQGAAALPGGIRSRGRAPSSRTISGVPRGAGLAHPSTVNAPWDDEPVTEEERKTVEEAERDLAAGNLIPHSEVLARLGLGDEDLDGPVERSEE